MDSVLNFLADYYYIFLGVSVVLLIALIGFIAGSRKKKPEVQTASETAQPNMTQTEPMGVQVDTYAPVTPEVTPQAVPEPATLGPTMPIGNEVAAQPATQPMVNDINVGMQLPPEEPVRSDEPTLIIEDPSATSTPSEPATPVTPEPVAPVQSEPVAPTAGQSIFEGTNTTNQPM
ncbi:MAG: hypothetical protein IKR57_05230 [Bacilli bacterium]|nr:hypothetical protein [Bacilli bacterium]